MPSKSDIALVLATRLLQQSGVGDFADTAKLAEIAAAANFLADQLYSSETTVASKFLLDEFDGTPAQITFRNSTDFSPTAANDLRHASAADTEVQLDLTSLANSTGYRQSTKVDLGDIRATAYKVRCVFEIAATPTAGNVIQLWWAPSQHATAGTGNPGNVSGADGAYTGYSSNASASVRQLDFIGNFVCTAQATGTVQVGTAGILVPAERYGSLVVFNNSGAALHSDAVEMHVVFDPVFIEGQ